MQVVKPEEVADVIRRAAELQHDLVVLRVRLSEADGPLAAVAMAICESVERRFGEAAESLREAAPALTTVTLD